MDSPSELRIICKVSALETKTQTHGSGRAVKTQLIHFPRILEAPVLAVVASPQQEHAQRARKQRQRGVDENTHEGWPYPLLLRWISLLCG